MAEEKDNNVETKPPKKQPRKPINEYGYLGKSDDHHTNADSFLDYYKNRYYLKRSPEKYSYDRATGEIKYVGDRGTSSADRIRTAREYAQIADWDTEMSLEERQRDFEKYWSMNYRDRKAYYDTQMDAVRGKEFADKVLGKDFKLDRLSEDSEIQDIKNRLEKNTRLSSEEKLARQETAYNALASSEQTQSRSMLKQLSAAGVRGGAAAGAIGQLAQQQAIGRREIAQNLYLQEQGFERDALDKYAQFQTQTKQFDIGQAEKEANMILQTQLAGISSSQNERNALRQLQNSNKK